MGVQLSTARLIAPAAFAINFGAQLYGIFSKPSMKEIADKNHYAFSPHPAFIGAFFAPQMILQLLWIRDLFRDKPVDEAQLQYTPIYVLGNLCIAGWMIFWNKEKFGLSQFLVTINTFSHLIAVARLPPINTANALTHWVAKTTAGIGILDFVDNGAVALRYPGPPSLLVKILTAGAFATASSLSDLILGACVVFDIVALAVGQQEIWGGTLGWIAAGSASIVIVKNVLLK